MRCTMKKKFKQLLFILCMVIAVTMSYTIFTHAGSSKTAYVAFGDSIAAGYGLEGYTADQDNPPADSYQSIISNFLKTSPANYAVTGDDSTDCINILESGNADNMLSEAGIITLSIGSNDLLKPFIEIVKETLGITEDIESLDPSLIEEYYSNLDASSILEITTIASKLSNELKDNAILHEKAQAFSDNFNKIIDIIKQKAPDATIYVTNIYNPYKDVMVLGEITETYIKEINTAFSKDSDNYTLIDLYTLFKNENLSNVKFNISDLSNINLDPHPSKEGHKRIAEIIIDSIEKKYAPAAASISQLKSTAKNTITIKLACKTDKSGYEIKFATSKNGRWNTLETSAKNTTKIKSSKLKPGKTYYIKARSFNEINGVKYYSQYSKIKKIQIKK